MRSNFPEPAIDWVSRGSWVGPVDIPWDRINDHSIDSWAASHQPAKVAEFARELKKDQNSVKPSICIQGHDGDKVDIIDGHHRALAHKKLGQPVRCYLGTVTNPKDVRGRPRNPRDAVSLGQRPPEHQVGADSVGAQHPARRRPARVLDPSKKVPHLRDRPGCALEKIHWGIEPRSGHGRVAGPGGRDQPRCVMDELTPYVEQVRGRRVSKGEPSSPSKCSATGNISRAHQHAQISSDPRAKE